jgi:hypothetical protein
MAVFVKLDRAWPVMLDGIAQPVQRTDAGIAAPGKTSLRAVPMPIIWS